MVKVMIEDDKNKDEITGEFFMGLMLTKEEKTEDSTTYKACAIGTGLSVPLERCTKPSLAMLRQWQSLPSV